MQTTFTTKFFRVIEFSFALAIVALLPFLFISGPYWLLTPAGRTFTNFGHIVFFGILTFLMFRRLTLGSQFKSVLIVLTVFFGGIAIELIQDQIGRDSSWSDVFKNMLGALFVLAWINKSSVNIWIARVVVSGMVLFPATMLNISLVNQYNTFQEFPIISSFESRFDYSRWRGRTKRVESFSSHGKSSMRVELRESRFSRFEISYFPRDWSGYSDLCFDIYNPDQAMIPLTIRINDYQHNRRSYDRYQDEFTIQPLWNYRCIPLDEIKTGPESRELNLEEVKRIVVYGYQLSLAHTIYTDNWRLQ